MALNLKNRISSIFSSKEYDPVCGMKVDPSSQYKYDYQGHTYHFCSQNDLDAFKANPSQYVKKVA